MSGCDVDEVLVVELVVFSKEVHVRRDLRGAGSLHSQREVGGQRGLITGVVQHRAGLHLSVQPDVSHAVLPELDGHLTGSKQRHLFSDRVYW